MVQLAAGARPRPAADGHPLAPRGEGFRLYWRWTSRTSAQGRPRTDADLRKLIGEMHEAKPLWGAPRSHGELLKLGIEPSQRAVGPLTGRKQGPPSQAWRRFLDKHLKELASSADFFVVPTAGFRLLYVLMVLRHERRRIVHLNVTAHPMAE